MAPNHAGQKLLQTLAPALTAIDDVLDRIALDRELISGTLRLTATRQAYEAVIRPLLGEFCSTYPHATVEVLIDYSLRDLLAEGFDAGIRLGEKLQQDMICLRAGPDLRMAVVASVDYLARRPAAQIPEDLYAHRCINYRMMSANSLYAWEFKKDGRKMEIGPPGPLTFNDPGLMLQAALDGHGVAYLPEHEVAAYLDDGRLMRMLPDWTQPFPGYYFYYPSRHQVSPVLSAFLDCVRARRELGLPQGRAFGR